MFFLGLSPSQRSAIAERSAKPPLGHILPSDSHPQCAAGRAPFGTGTGNGYYMLFIS